MGEYWNCYWWCQEGEDHRSRNLMCQDRVAYKEKGSKQAIAIVDGVGETNCNPLAGEMIANAVAEFLTEHFEDVLTEMNYHVGTILMKKIYDVVLFAMQQYGLPAKEFDFTLIGACIDHKTGKYCTVHLGDGAIVCGGEKPRVLSYPFHGMAENAKCRVLSDQVLKYLKFQSGWIGDVEYLALCTDGVYGKRDRIKTVFDKICNLRMKTMMQTGVDDMGIIMLESRQNSVVS